MGFIILIMAYTEEELQEIIERLVDLVDAHEEALACIVSALRDEESLSEDTMDGIKEAYKVIYG